MLVGLCGMAGDDLVAESGRLEEVSLLYFLYEASFSSLVRVGGSEGKAEASNAGALMRSDAAVNVRLKPELVESLESLLSSTSPGGFVLPVDGASDGLLEGSAGACDDFLSGSAGSRDCDVFRDGKAGLILIGASA